MGADPAKVRARVGNHQDRSDGLGRPTAVPRDARGEAPFAIERAEELVDVDDLGLQLDGEQGSAIRVVREHVDDATLRTDRERHLRSHDPLRTVAPEPARDVVVERGVAGVEQAVEVAAAPPRDEVQSTSRAAATRRMVSSGMPSRWPRSILEIWASEVCAGPPSCFWVSRRRIRIARIVAPKRWSSIPRWSLGALRGRLPATSSPGVDQAPIRPESVPDRHGATRRPSRRAPRGPGAALPRTTARRSASDSSAHRAQPTRGVDLSPNPTLPAGARHRVTIWQNWNARSICEDPGAVHSPTPLAHNRHATHPRTEPRSPRTSGACAHVCPRPAKRNI